MYHLLCVKMRFIIDSFTYPQQWRKLNNYNFEENQFLEFYENSMKVLKSRPDWTGY